MDLLHAQTDYYFAIDLCNNYFMLGTILGILIRIFSNSFLNVFQKLLTNDGNKSSHINFFTYLFLSIISVTLIPISDINFSSEIIQNFLIMGFLGALGNYFIIKALSIGELSSLAPINSYKPVIAMIAAFLYLKEIPSFFAILGILLIIFGTYILYFHKNSTDKKAVIYRVLALILSGTEAVFIKKIILLTNIPVSFMLWCFAGLIFSSVFIINSGKINKIPNLKYMALLVLSVGIMQYSTNYVFSHINVSYALAIFQLSTIISVLLGINIFKEKGLYRKITASVIMILGAILIILC